MKLPQALTEGIDYSGVPAEIVESADVIRLSDEDRLKQFKPHEQEWGIREHHSGENINNITDSITIYNNNIRDNRFSSILARHNPNYRNILNFTSRIIHAALIEYEELKAPKPSNRKLQESRREWSIQEPPYSRILVDSDRVRVIRVTRVDDTGSAAKIASDMSYKSGWCTVSDTTSDNYLKRDDLYFILLDGEKYLYHAESEQLMNFKNRPSRLSVGVYGLLSEHAPGIGLFVHRRSKIYKNAIMQNPTTSYEHAIIEGKRWTEAEPIIMMDPYIAYKYARDVLRGKRWPEAEPHIMSDPRAAYEYAHYVLKCKRWMEAEPTIMKDPHTACKYAINVLKGNRWSEAEPAIMRDPGAAYEYAHHVLKCRRWPEAEPTIMNNAWAASKYAHYVLKGERWPEAEPTIIKNPGAACYYANNILKCGWPEAEENILNSNYANLYRDRFNL